MTLHIRPGLRTRTLDSDLDLDCDNNGRGEPLQKQINNDDENKSVCEGEGDKMCKWVELGERRVKTKYEETLNRSLT